MLEEQINQNATQRQRKDDVMLNQAAKYTDEFARGRRLRDIDGKADLGMLQGTGSQLQDG